MPLRQAPAAASGDRLTHRLTGRSPLARAMWVVRTRRGLGGDSSSKIAIYNNICYYIVRENFESWRGLAHDDGGRSAAEFRFPAQGRNQAVREAFRAPRARAGADAAAMPGAWTSVAQ